MNPEQQMNPDQGTWRTYGITDGLPDLRCEHVIEDKDGYLWVSTWGVGVCRFDGDEFRVYNTKDGLPSVSSLAVLQDRRDRLWVGTSAGLCLFNGSGFDHLAGTETMGDASFLTEACDGRVWVTGGGTLGYIDGDRYCDLIPRYRQQHGEDPFQPWPSHCYGIAEDGDGGIWFGHDSGNGTVTRYDGERFQRVGVKVGLPASTPVPLAADGDGLLYVAVGSELLRRDGPDTFSPIPSPTEMSIRKLVCDQDGLLWICTQGDGAYSWDGRDFRHFSRARGLGHGFVNGVCRDREGQVWFATWGGGLSLFSSRLHKLHHEDETVDASAVLADSTGQVWVTFGSVVDSLYGRERLFRYADGGLSPATTDGVSPPGHVMFEDRQGALWLGGLNRLGRWQGGRFEDLTDRIENRLPDVLFTCMGEDSEGRPLVGFLAQESAEFTQPSRIRLDFFDGESFHERVSIPWEQGSGAILSVLAASSGDLWFASSAVIDTVSTAGVRRIRPSGEVVHYTDQDGLAANNVHHILQDRHGNLWMCTDGGISCYDGERFHSYTVADGLPSDRVHGALEDPDGRLFFATEGGVCCFNGSDFQTVAQGLIQSTFDLDQDSAGNLWLATSTGAIRYTPSRTPPRIRVVEVLADRVYEPQEQIRFANSTSRIAFEFKGMSFSTKPRNMLYSWCLLGLEEAWCKPVHEMRAFYQNLEPGDYTFQVQGIDQDLNHSVPVEVGFTVTRSAQDERIDELEQRVRERTVELQGANEQLEGANRELTVQNALERVRARALGMQNSEDIGEVVWDLFEESRALGLPIYRVIIRLFIDEQPHDIWFASVLSERENKAGHVSGVGGGPPDGSGMDEARRRGDDWHVGDWELPDEERTWELGRLRERGLDPQESQRRVETIPDRIYAHRVFFKEGLVAYQAPRRLDDSVLSVLKRFTDVFAIAYTRHAELLKKEEQNRALEAANAQLEQASLNKSQFLRRMSHDLRSPMNAIIGYSRLLQRRLADRMDEREARNLANIETSSGNLLSLINDILDLSRIEAGRIEIDVQSVDVRSLAHECADALESIVHAGVKLNRSMAAVGQIQTDPERLRQVIMNLLGNATKFTKSGSITLSLRRDGDAFELSIADTGIGIPAADLPHIFDEFRQVERQGGEQSEGTGLGLAIAKKTVDLLGGEMTATSEVGVGTTFTVRLEAPPTDGSAL